MRPGDTAAANRVDGWLQDYASRRDPVLRERIILAYLGLADRLADRYRHSRGTTPRGPAPDRPGRLIAAIDRHSPDYANPVVAYAVACVVGEIKRHLRDTSWRLHVPQLLKEHSMQLYKAADQLQQTLGRSPPLPSWPSVWGGRGGRLEALTVAQSRQELSLDRPVGDDTERCLSDLGLPRTQGGTRRPLGPPSADRGTARARPQGHRLAVLPLLSSLVQQQTSRSTIKESQRRTTHHPSRQGEGT
ncbi:MAG TPA: hypothetical protein VG673_23595 [Actinomycetota bacterium]|nr:hypothetical protein [Actinomycetota bacterium]